MASETKHTPGPWSHEPTNGFGDEWEVFSPYPGLPDEPLWIATCSGMADECGSTEANARLIAAAPDHALICWAMCVGAGRWEPFGDGRGEFCMNGLRHSTELDEFGCPRVTDGMRAALVKAGAP